MDSITLFDGLVLTVVSMLIVFLVLGVIGFIINFVSKFIGEEPSVVTETATPTPVPGRVVTSTDSLQANEEYQFVAEMMALVLASEDEPDRKFEVVETKRIH